MRMCAICRQQFPKRELIRLAKTSDGRITLDDTGKKPGRGVYICHGEDCLAQALKGARLEKAVGVKVDPDILNELKVKAENES